MKIYNSKNVKNKSDKIFMIAFLIIFAMCFLPFLLKKAPETRKETKQPASEDSGQEQLYTDAEFTVNDKPGIRIKYSDTNTTGLEEKMIGSDAVILYDRQTKTVLYSRNADKRLFPASTTKILTACAALRYLSPDTIITAGSELDFIEPDSSLAYINKDCRLTLEDALYGLLLPSGNDAAYIIAVNTARAASGNSSMTDEEAVKYFAGIMNDEALEAGAENSHFCVPDGYHTPEHYTTAEDMLKIAVHSAKYPLIAEICSQPDRETTIESGQGYYWENGNCLVVNNNKYYLPFATGLKTGFTDEAGYCMAATANQDGHDLVAVIMNAPSLSTRYTDAARMFWSVIDPVKLQESLVTTAVTTEPPADAPSADSAGEQAPVTEPAA
ncbi:MAG: D-alanyl-D-alanine carboxypeptidase [Oscillospiraceae bacterium]|nr:D-alanyl-D-alanine carboxypeptidase [Oscillospiraceae bacterium]